MGAQSDNLPALGTKAAAVAAIESLIFRAIGSKDLEPWQLRYWLDAYYQARKAQETEEAEQAAAREREAFLAGLIKNGPPRASAPTVETKYSAAPEDAAETQQKPEPAAKAQRPSPVGWTDGNQIPTDPAVYSGAAAAAKFKREQFERLQRFLREGVTMQRIVKAADGNITEDQILGIRECRRVPVAVYRVLEAALDRIETD